MIPINIIVPSDVEGADPDEVLYVSLTAAEEYALADMIVHALASRASSRELDDVADRVYETKTTRGGMILVDALTEVLEQLTLAGYGVRFPQHAWFLDVDNADLQSSMYQDIMDQMPFINPKTRKKAGEETKKKVLSIWKDAWERYPRIMGVADKYRQWPQRDEEPIDLEQAEKLRQIADARNIEERQKLISYGATPEMARRIAADYTFEDGIVPDEEYDPKWDHSIPTGKVPREHAQIMRDMKDPETGLYHDPIPSNLEEIMPSHMKQFFLARIKEQRVRVAIDSGHEITPPQLPDLYVGDQKIDPV